jgi:integrase
MKKSAWHLHGRSTQFDETESAILFQREDAMRGQHADGLTLFGPSGSRKYLNAVERIRFERAAARAPPRVGLFCLTPRWTGGRISEVLAVAPASFDLDSGVISLETLKRRRRGIVRQVPVPPDLLDQLDREFDLRTAQHDPNLANRRIWRCSRTTAWRQVKSVMAGRQHHRSPCHAEGPTPQLLR